jgi:hypothetical protein
MNANVQQFCENISGWTPSSSRRTKNTKPRNGGSGTGRWDAIGDILLGAGRTGKEEREVRGSWYIGWGVAHLNIVYLVLRERLVRHGLLFEVLGVAAQVEIESNN